jgi:pimeloyl-ACP methyl ester carboxylesterase
LLEVFVMPSVKVNDIMVYYEVKGEGFPLVMIMGLGGNVDWWDPRMVLGLSKNFRMVMFDNRGAGRTDVSDREYTIGLFADDTAGLMDALGVSRAHVLGISMGGMIAQELVLNHPERVEKLVLCSTFCGGAKSVQADPEVLGTLTADLSGLSAEEVAKIIVPFCLTKDFIDDNPDFVERMTRQILRAPISGKAFTRQLSAIMEFDTFDRLSQVRAPTLVLRGRRDILIPPENGSILAEAIPDARLVNLEKSAHGLAEDMEEATKAITEFLL